MDETITNKIMASPRAKLRNAKRHINTLEEHTTIIPSCLFGISTKPKFSSYALINPDSYVLNYTPNPEINSYYQSIIGDTVNNIRESLDFFMSNLVKQSGASMKVHFPISEKSRKLSNTRYWDKLNDIVPETLNYIQNTIIPAKDGTSEIWAVNELCNLNKHNEFAPSFVNANIEFENVTFGRGGKNGGMSPGKFEFDANIECNILEHFAEIFIQGGVRVTGKLKFKNEGYFANKMVIPVLHNTHEVISNTLESLEEFLLKTEKL